MKRKSSFIVAGMLISLAVSNTLPVLSIDIHAEDGLKQCAVIVGKEDKKFKTISEAVKKASANDTIKVYPGLYPEKINVSTNNIKIVGEDGVVIGNDGNKQTVKPDEDGEALLHIKGDNIEISNLEFANFKIKGPSDSVCPKAIDIDGPSNHVTISNCKVHDIGVVYTDDSEEYNAHGIIAGTSPSKPITDVTITGCELYNLTLGQSEALVVNGNVDKFNIFKNYIHDCDNIAIDAIGYERDKNNEKDRARNGEISENTVVNISSKNNNAYGGDISAGGIYVDGGCDINIRNNYVQGADIGIEVSSEHKKKTVTGVKVYDNVLVNNNGWAGICIGGSDPDDNGDAANNQIYNNTVYNTESACLRIQNAHNSNNKIQKNIFIATDSAKAYSEECGKNSSGNTVNQNMSNVKMSAGGNSTFKLKGASTTNMTLEIASYDDLSGYGAARTKFVK